MDDTIEVAPNADIQQRRRSSLLRPTVVRGDSYEHEGRRKGSLRPISTGSLRPISVGSVGPLSTGTLRPISTASSTLRRPSTKGTYKPEWAEDVGNVPVTPAPEIDQWQTPEDLKDMLRMGRAQEMKRVFRTFSLISFGCLSQCTWEFVLLNNNQTLEAGGPALLFWSYVWSFAGYLLVTASLAEMCSMAPSSGGQYHYVSEFASKRCQQFLSYITGWMTILAWQCGNAAGLLLTGSLFQCIITIYRPANGDSAWQTIVFLLPCISFVTLINIFGGKSIAMTQNVAMSGHILALIALIVIMSILSPHIPVERALLNMENTQWPNVALAALAGQSNANFSCSYSDSSIHMAEEVQDAGIAVPKAMMRSFYLSGICGFLIVLTFVFCIPSVSDAYSHPTGYSFLYVMQLSVPNGVTVCALVVLIWLISTSNVGFSAATVRITYAFARDQGLPFSAWIAKINKKQQIPVNAVFLTAAISVLLSLVYVASMTAFYGIFSLALSAQSMSYILAISSILYRRIKSPEKLPKPRWSLGQRWGPVINILAILFSINTFIWAFSPANLPMTSANFNVAVILFFAAILLMMATYYLGARKKFVGPVERTRDVPNWNMSQMDTGMNMQFLTIPEEDP